jgi:hypothetical protein
MFAGLADAFARIAPEAVAVTIVGIVFKLLTYAIDNEDRWRRLMSLVAPLMALVLTLAVVAAWWLLADGGIHVLLHDFGRT